MLGLGPNLIDRESRLVGDHDGDNDARADESASNAAGSCARCFGIAAQCRRSLQWLPDGVAERRSLYASGQSAVSEIATSRDR